MFFDTLLESLSNDELEAVLAHELGHFKRKHIIKSMILSFALSLLGLWLLSWLMKNDWFYHALGVSNPSTYMALLLFALVVPIFTFTLSPIFSMLSRKNEFEADAFAAEQTNANNLIQALVNMYKENASTLTPDPLYSAFYDSHPPAPVRIAHLAKTLITENPMKKNIFFILLGVALSNTAAGYEDPVMQTGKKLHDEKCMNCHDTSVYSRQDSPQSKALRLFPTRSTTA